MQHHAYIHEGPLALLGALADDARARFGFGDLLAALGAGHPDVHVREFEKFGIDESRWLAQTAALRSSGGSALFVIGAGSLTGESQQALLKLFEEPQAGVIFVLLAPYGEVVPTLRSRMLEYGALQIAAEKALGPAMAMPDLSLAGNFLAANQKARSEMIAKLLKDDEGAKERVRELLLGFETALAGRIAEPKVREALEDIAKVRSYVGDRSASLKMLLEHLAIALPKI